MPGIESHIDFSIERQRGEMTIAEVAPRLDAAVRGRLVPVREDAAHGAVRLVRQLAQEALEETA